MGGAGLCRVTFVYKIVEITAASSNNGGGPVLGLLCMGRNRAGSNLAVHFHFFPRRIFLSVDRSHLRRNRPNTVHVCRVLMLCIPMLLCIYLLDNL